MAPCCVIIDMEISLKNDNEDHSVIQHYLGMTMNQMRHLEVSRIIEAKAIKSVLDLGCSEGLLLQKLSRSEQIQLLVGVDLDQTAVSSAVLNTYPQNIQQSIQFHREVDQHIHIYAGDATREYRLLKEKKFQMVTMVEVIEHLPLQDVGKAVENVFGWLQPQFCFVSTPNQEFNVFFNFQEGQTRHYDHKFQWNRAQFQAFCKDIRKKYRYQFTLGGIGEHINDDSKGKCTQYALFTRPLSHNQEKERACLPQSCQDQLEERAHYQNISWRSNKEKVIRTTLFKSLYFSEDLSLEEGVLFIQKQPIGKCLQNDKISIDREFLLACLKKNQADFQIDGERYRAKRGQTQQESKDEQGQQSDIHPAHLLEGASYELSISKSNIFEKEGEQQE